jgi:ubiquinone/menaquinone biosynthesis C-methylase UbiE
MGDEPRYVPAAGWRVFTRFYDPVFALTMRERRFRGEMGDRANRALPEGGTLLDVGSGTGTFAIDLASRRPDARVVGIDGDPEILAIARGKRGAEAVEWHQALAGELPLEDGSVDVVTISMVLHHLLPDQKREALGEMRRALSPGGLLLVTDWGAPQDPIVGAVFYVSQAIDGFDRTADHRAGRLPGMIEGSGFGPVERYDRLRTGFGALDLLAARPA